METTWTFVFQLLCPTKEVSMYTSVLGRQVTLCLLCVRAGPFKGTVPLCGLKLHRILVLC